ncbi:hypothetical protein HPB52_025050 [Rhipicephalus sanguineus]|uniref:Uncharacterized protein n=1 Tax=Rhipicephalus sanguineus TaxID=34632 RepID=A0A9D4YRZ8_RHISA|nr:hypothetical protein HPB52_025050 [Rhipicephalus sanguineus]
METDSCGLCWKNAATVISPVEQLILPDVRDLPVGGGAVAITLCLDPAGHSPAGPAPKGLSRHGLTGETTGADYTRRRPRIDDDGAGQEINSPGVIPRTWHISKVRAETFPWERSARPAPKGSMRTCIFRSPPPRSTAALRLVARGELSGVRCVGNYNNRKEPSQIRKPEIRLDELDRSIPLLRVDDKA